MQQGEGEEILLECGEWREDHGDRAMQELSPARERELGEESGQAHPKEERDPIQDHTGRELEKLLEKETGAQIP